MNDPKSRSQQHVCIVNVGTFRTGTTTLVEAAKSLGLKTYRKFPELSQDQHKGFLQKPEKLVLDWFLCGGMKELLGLASRYDLICDGWMTLLPFLPPSVLESLKQEAQESGVLLNFLATTRDVESTVRSELQHWTVHDLEGKAGLTRKERESLKSSLLARADNHHRCTQHLEDLGLLAKTLPLADIHDAWPKALSLIARDFTVAQWEDALSRVGKQNANPSLPLEGVLLTLRLGSGPEAEAKMLSVECLLGQIEQDHICQYLVVLAIDEDEKDGDASQELARRLASRPRLHSLHPITNHVKNPDQPFEVCSTWHTMATIAWKNGADWVVLLGDDIEIDCSFHYRAIYRSFLAIAKGLNVPFGFGCPCFNDATFPNFPSFPCVGKAHYEIFGGLIPEDRRSSFVNQDLDPYLQRLYMKFRAAPCVIEAILFNGAGGNIGSKGKARYERVHAQGWRDFAPDDIESIRKYLPQGASEALLVDVIIPSYRVRLNYLQSICSLKVPENFRTFFIIIVDNPDALLRSAALLTKRAANDMTLHQGERILEEYLSEIGNRVRVRCNTTNLGASASRNRGLDESAAEFVLHLDDDLVPRSDLLEQYGRKLQDIDDDVVGLVGLVRFPRSSTLSLRHAAVLMSYLTFMFEIAERNMYTSPAWGVTANILFRRTSVRFDLAYAKTGGGEDVDFSLRVTEASKGGKLLAVPEACVVHPFWPGSVWTLSRHFFNWAIGDGALFKRFPKYCYWSFPNVPEMLTLLSPLSLWFGPWKVLKLVPGFLLADFVVDISNRTEYKHRCLQLQSNQPTDSSLLEQRSRLFYFLAHCLANMYVIVLECGRLWGHVTRKDPWQGLCHRFDWHCGRLENAPRNFRKREAYKFGLFLAVLVYEFGWHIGSNSCAYSWKDLALTMIARK